MKRSIVIACALAIGSSLGIAEDQAFTQNPATSSAEQYQPHDMRLFDSSKIENKKVMDQDGNDLGKLEKLLIDAESGRVRFAVVQVDKKWSLNDPEVIVPFKTLQISRIGETDIALKIEATRDKLMNAPHFDKKLVHQLTTREAGQPIYTYWGATWSEDTGSGTALSQPSTGTTSATSPYTSTAPTSTTPSPATKTSTGAPTDASSPTTTTDGSAGTQSIGNSGTSDSPKPEPSPGKPSTGDLNTEPKPGGLNKPSETPDRARGGNETD